MTDIIQAGIEIDVTGVDRGEVALKRLAQAGEQVDRSFERGAKAAKGAGDATAQAGREADKARGSFGGFAQETKEMAAATNSLASAAGKLGTVLGSAFALNKTISTITAFEDSILRLRATSNASADDMAQLEKQARTLGATSSYSAGQAADAQNFLAMAGLKVNEIMAATPSVMKFASAASIDLARSADIATNVLGGMQLPVSELERTMNSMVNTAQSANTDISQLGSAFAYAAPLAVTAAIDVETLAASIGVLGDAGIQGSRAGTGMVGVIRQLSNATPDAQKALATYGLTMADVDIKSRGLVNALDTLKKANLSTSDAMKIFGSESASAALILSSSAGKVRELAAANAEAAGKLDEVAGILDSSLSKSFAAVSSAIEEFMLQTGDSGLSKTLKILSTTVAGLINNMNGMLPEFAKASGISQEFERNIRAVSITLKVVGTGIAAYGLAVTVAAAKTQAAAALNALYALSLREVAKDATLAAKAVTTIQKSIALLAAAMVGWEIGTYLRKEFEIVEKAGIALMSALHQWSAQIHGTFLVMGENIKFAFLNPIDAVRSAIADLVAWIAGLGTGVASAMGFDTSGWEESIAKAHSKIRGANAAEHSKTIAQIKANTAKEITAISDGYASLFADVGKSSKETSKAIAGTIKTTKELGEEVVVTDKKIAASAGTTKELARALKELEREQEKNTKSAVDAAKALSKGNDELRREIDSIGKTKRELVIMEQQRNNVTATALKEAAAVLDVSIAQEKELGTTKDLIALKEKERDAILEQIDLIGERNRLLGERIDTEEVYESQKKIADQWQSLSDDMGRTFTDAIIQGGANAKEAIKRMFTNMVLRPIVEPIMQGVAGMFTGVLGGGQSGGLMGMLGGGSGGGGFSLGNVASMGSKIYSAFTGWGRAAVEGWNNSGVTGIFTGIRDYYAGTLSGMGGGLSALTAGMKGAYLAPGLAGPTTAGAAGMMGVGNMLGNLSRMAGPLSIIAGALQGYQTAGIKGAAVGAGTAWGGAKLGAMAGSFLGPIGSAIGGALGGVLGAIGGSKLFGGKWRTKDVGLGLSFDGGEFSGQQFEYRKKKGGLFSKGKKKTIWTALDEEIHDALSEAMADSVSSTKGLFEALGFEIADDALSGLRTGIEQISTMGKDEEKIQEEISDWLSKTNEAVAGELHKVLGTGLDLNLEDLTAFVGNLLGVNEMLGVIGLTAFESSVAGAKLAESLSELGGGLVSLAANADVYYKNFFSAEERSEHAFAAMKKALDDAGLSAIDSREAYRQAVEGLDLTTEAGREMFAAMMAMAGTAAEYFGIMEGYQSQLADMQAVLDADPVLGYTAVLEVLQGEFDQMAKELGVVGLATTENLDILSQFSQHMKEMAALDLFEGGQGMADALRQGLLGSWDGEDIGSYLAQSISDGVYGAIAGQFANQITDILLQGIVAPMINAALTGAVISEAVTKESIAAMVARAQSVAKAAADVMGALKDSGVLDELRKGLGVIGLTGFESSVAEAKLAEIAAYNSQLDAMKEALSAEPVLAYTAVLEALQADFDSMAAKLEAVGLATEDNLATLEQFRQKMAEMAALDLFEGGRSMADALRQGLMGTWDGEAIGDYLARSISDGVYGAIAGQFANQITDILLQGIVAPMINAALTGASISEAVSSSTISSMVAQAQAVAQAASEVMGALKESGVMDELQKALGGGFTLPRANYIMPAYRPPVAPTPQPVDDSWKRLLESIVKQTDHAQQQIADMGRTAYEKGLAAIASTVADYQAQIAQSTASKRKQLTQELALMEQAERRLLEAQMDQRAADMLAGLADELERMGKTDAELAIMNIEKQTQDYIKSLHDVGRATAGNIAQVEAWSQAMKDAAAKDAQIRAASGAFDALGRAVDSQRSVITEALERARDVAGAAGSAAKDLFAGVLGASAASAEQARAFISDALSTARGTGYLPDGDRLREAIDSATRDPDDAAAVSIADANWQKLVLANQLKELADLAEPQVDYAQSQLDALDNMLENARDQLDVLQGIDNSVLTVAEALSRFNEVVGNGQIITPESPVFTPEMPPRQTATDNRAQEVNAELVAEVIELRNYMREIQRETKRTADAVNGRGDAPMLVETV